MHVFPEHEHPVPLSTRDFLENTIPDKGIHSCVDIRNPCSGNVRKN